MAFIIKPPAPIEFDPEKPSLFLAGSIEMGAAPEWQTQVERALSAVDMTILNPRREQWDDSWEQSIADERFRSQVEWELLGQDKASIIAAYFAPRTKAPITLLELGLFARTGKMVVCCPQGFWRRGNVEIVCRRFEIPLFESLDELIGEIKRRVQSSATM